MAVYMCVSPECESPGYGGFEPPEIGHCVWAVEGCNSPREALQWATRFETDPQAIEYNGGPPWRGWTAKDITDWFDDRERESWINGGVYIEVRSEDDE